MRRKRTSVRLRRASTDDAGAILYLERYFPTDRFSRRAVRYLLRCRNAHAFVVEHEGEVAGVVIMLIRRNSRVARIYSIAVSPEVRNRGLGAALLRAAEAEARRLGRTGMSLEVRHTNRPARTLYDRLGYEVVSRLPRYYENGVDALRMRKALGAERAYRRSRSRTSWRRPLRH